MEYKRMMSAVLAAAMALTVFSGCGDKKSVSHKADSSSEKEKTDSSSAEEKKYSMTKTTTVKVGDENFTVYEQPILFNYQEIPYEEWLAYKSPFDEYVDLVYDDHSGNYDVEQTVAFAIRYAYENDIEFVSFPMAYDTYMIYESWDYAGIAFVDIPMAFTSCKLEATDDGYYQLTVSDAVRKAAKHSDETIKAAKEIVDSIPDECETQVEKAYYLYDWVCQNVVYDQYHADNTGFVNNVPQSVYGAIVEKRAVCDGIAGAVQLLFSMAGIECGKLAGKDVNDTVGHVWNYAVVDGEVWDFDATWDAKKYYDDEDGEPKEYDPNPDLYLWFGVERAAKSRSLSLNDMTLFSAPPTEKSYTEASPCMKIYNIVESVDHENNEYKVFIDGKEIPEDDPVTVTDVLEREGQVRYKINDEIQLVAMAAQYSSGEQKFEDVENIDLITYVDTDVMAMILEH